MGQKAFSEAMGADARGSVLSVGTRHGWSCGSGMTGMRQHMLAVCNEAVGSWGITARSVAILLLGWAQWLGLSANSISALPSSWDGRWE